MVKKEVCIEALQLLIDAVKDADEIRSFSIGGSTETADLPGKLAMEQVPTGRNFISVEMEIYKKVTKK